MKKIILIIVMLSLFSFSHPLLLGLAVEELVSLLGLSVGGAIVATEVLNNPKFPNFINPSFGSGGSIVPPVDSSIVSVGSYGFGSGLNLYGKNFIFDVVPTVSYFLTTNGCAEKRATDWQIYTHSGGKIMWRWSSHWHKPSGATSGCSVYYSADSLNTIKGNFQYIILPSSYVEPSGINPIVGAISSSADIAISSVKNFFKPLTLIDYSKEVDVYLRKIPNYGGLQNLQGGKIIPQPFSIDGDTSINYKGQIYNRLGVTNPSTCYYLGISNGGYSSHYNPITGVCYTRPVLHINPITKDITQSVVPPQRTNPLLPPPNLPQMETDPSPTTTQAIVEKDLLNKPWMWDTPILTNSQVPLVQDEIREWLGTAKSFPMGFDDLSSSGVVGAVPVVGNSAVGSNSGVDTTAIEALLADILSALGFQGLLGEIQHNGEKLDDIKDKSGEIATNTDRIATAVEALNEKFDSSDNDIPTMPTEEFNNGFSYISDSLSSRSLNSYQVNLLDTSGSCTMDFVWNGHNFPLCFWFGRIIPFLSMFFNFSLVLINFYFFMIYKEKILEIFGKGK